MANEPLRLPGVKGRTPTLQKLVYELRYRQGYTYLDKCGRIINLIQRDYPEWIVQGDQVSPQNASLVSLQNASIFNFSSLNLSLALEKPLGQDPLSQTDVQRFIDQADGLTALVSDQLGIGQEQLTRIGFRTWFIFPCQDQQDAARWLGELGFYSVSPLLSQAFGGAIESAAVSVVITGEDRSYRITFTGGERQAQIDLGEAILSIRPRSLPENQKHFLIEQMKTKTRLRQTPEVVAIIDIDCYQEDPQVLDVRHFVQSSWDESLNRFRAALGK
jgi:hypothetical protein